MSKPDFDEVIFAICDLYGRTYQKNGIVYVEQTNGVVWDFTVPARQLKLKDKENKA